MLRIIVFNDRSTVCTIKNKKNKFMLYFMSKMLSSIFSDIILVLCVTFLIAVFRISDELDSIAENLALQSSTIDKHKLSGIYDINHF